MRFRFRDKTPSFRLEHRFLLYWQSLGGPLLEHEYRFNPTRKWRADFAHVASRTLIEVEGGIYIHCRHNRPQGFADDDEKCLEAALDGWRVLRLSELQVTAPTIERIVTFIRTAGVKKRPNLTPIEARISARQPCGRV